MIKVLKLCKKRTAALLMIAVTVMFGTAWAATQQIEYNDTLDLTKVVDGNEYVPSKNGTNTVTLTGRLGEGVTSCDKNNFTIYLDFGRN